MALRSSVVALLSLASSRGQFTNPPEPPAPHRGPYASHDSGEVPAWLGDCSTNLDTSTYGGYPTLPGFLQPFFISEDLSGGSSPDYGAYGSPYGGSRVAANAGGNPSLKNYGAGALNEVEVRRKLLVLCGAAGYNGAYTPVKNLRGSGVHQGARRLESETEPANNVHANPDAAARGLQTTMPTASHSTNTTSNLVGPDGLPIYHPGYSEPGGFYGYNNNPQFGNWYGFPPGYQFSPLATPQDNSTAFGFPGFGNYWPVWTYPFFGSFYPAGYPA